jgi:hypothetical protein
MGLDGVELIMAIEAGFGVVIPNDAAERLATPRDVVTYLELALPVGGPGPCLSQRAFYRLRDRCSHHLRVSPRVLHPKTPLDEVVDGEARRGAWDAIGADLGAERWPPPRSASWVGRYFRSGRPGTVGEAARYAATWYPRAVKGADEGWTRAEIERAVVALIQVEIGVDMRRHTLDSQFVRDMGID